MLGHSAATDPACVRSSLLVAGLIVASTWCQRGTSATAWEASRPGELTERDLSLYATSDDGRVIVVGNSIPDGGTTLIIWDAERRVAISHPLDRHAYTSSVDLLWHGDSGSIAVGWSGLDDTASSVDVVNLPKRRLLRRFLVEYGSELVARLSPDGGRLAIFENRYSSTGRGRGSRLSVYRLAGYHRVTRTGLATGIIQGSCWRTDGRLILLDRDSAMEIWRITDRPRLERRVKIPPGQWIIDSRRAGTAVALSDGRRLLLLPTPRSRIQILTSPLKDKILGVGMDVSGRYAAVRSAEGVALWDRVKDSWISTWVLRNLLYATGLRTGDVAVVDDRGRYRLIKASLSTCTP